MEIRILLEGSPAIAYRDPACIWDGSEYRLFCTRSVLDADGYMYNTVAYCRGPSLDRLSAPADITVRDRLLNYCSPGCILKVGKEYLIPVSSYPLPFPCRERAVATDDARIFLIRTEDFVTFSAPEPILAKGDTPLSDLGRMIDPCLFRDGEDEGLYHLFFKQNGIGHSHSRDLIRWTYDGHIDGGENASVYRRDGLYHLYHSPANGVGHKVSSDLLHWKELGVSTLGQSRLPFASGRITAGYFTESAPGEAHPYLLFFHGSRADCPPETHGGATLAAVYLDSTDLPDET